MARSCRNSALSGLISSSMSYMVLIRTCLCPIECASRPRKWPDAQRKRAGLKPAPVVGTSVDGSARPLGNQGYTEDLALIPAPDHEHIAELLLDPGDVVARIEEPLERRSHQRQRYLPPLSPPQRRPPDDVVALVGCAPHDVVAIGRRAPHDVVAIAGAPDDVVTVAGAPNDVVAVAGRAPHDVAAAIGAAAVGAPHDVVAIGARAPDDVVAVAARAPHDVVTVAGRAPP